jgi:hypothetical protein
MMGKFNKSVMQLIGNILAASALLFMGFFQDHAHANSFDGDWKADVNCPATSLKRGAREVSFSFKARVSDSEFIGGLRTLPEVGSIEVKGKINTSGDVLLQVVGYHKDPENNIARADVGSIYTYAVKSKFGIADGKGERTTGRDCFYRFTKITV